VLRTALSLPKGRRTSALDQSITKSGPAQQALLESSHPSAVALMIVAEKVQEAVQRQDPKLSREMVAKGAGLAAGDAGGDDDVA